MDQGDAGTLALFPLCGEADATRHIEHVSHALPTATIEPICLSVGELETLLAGPKPVTSVSAHGFGAAPPARGDHVADGVKEASMPAGETRSWRRTLLGVVGAVMAMWLAIRRIRRTSTHSARTRPRILHLGFEDPRPRRRRLHAYPRDLPPAGAGVRDHGGVRPVCRCPAAGGGRGPLRPRRAAPGIHRQSSLLFCSSSVGPVAI